jgi:hypothetical protein
MRKLIAWAFMYSLDGLLADEGTESWQSAPLNRRPTCTTSGNQASATTGPCRAKVLSSRLPHPRGPAAGESNVHDGKRAR